MGWNSDERSSDGMTFFGIGLNFVESSNLIQLGTLLQSTFYGGATSGLFSTLTSAGAAGLSSTTLGLKLFYEYS